VLIGVSLAGLGGALAGCSTAAVPYDADEAGVAPNAPSLNARATKKTKVTGTVLGQASDIPVGGGAIYTAAKVVVTQPSPGQYKAFSAVCTHVGCIMNKVANGTIDCPCHGSEFTITNGAVVTGPAPSPLPRKKIKIVNGQVLLL
jgi:Rieske Fe-S protein